MNGLEVDLEDVGHCKISDVPLWTSRCPTYNYHLASEKKAANDPIIFKNKFLEVEENFFTHEEIDTDRGLSVILF